MIHKNRFFVRKVNPHIITQRVQHVKNTDIRLVPRVHMDQNVPWRSQPAIMHHASFTTHHHNVDIFTIVSSHSCCRSIGWYPVERMPSLHSMYGCFSESMVSRREKLPYTLCVTTRHKMEKGKRFKSRKVCRPFERRFTQAAQLLMNASLACESIEWRETQCSQREPVRSRYRCRRRDTHRCRMPCYSMWLGNCMYNRSSIINHSFTPIPRGLNRWTIGYKLRL